MNALKRAAEILREDAESIRQSHTLGGDWQSEDKAKADHDEMLAVAEQLDALNPTKGKDSAVQQAQIWAQETRTQKGIVAEIGKLVGCSNDWEIVGAVKAALQPAQGEAVGIACVGYGETVGQSGFTQYVKVTNLIPEGTKLYTHPAPVAVPVGWKLVDKLRDISVEAANLPGALGVSVDRKIHDVIAMLTAAPSPGRIAEGGEVEEIQAGALETYADQLDEVFARAQEAGADNCPAWHAGQFAKDARKQAARLRQSGNAGDDGEVQSNEN